MEIKTNEANTLMADTWAKRGIQKSDAGVQQRLSKIGSTVLQGYHVAIASEDLKAIAPKINEIDAELQGFAYEGVGMALAQRDLLAPSSENRMATLVAGDGAAYHNWVYVGLGLMLARAGLPIKPHLNKLNFERSCLAIDGYGYYQGMFRWQDSLDNQAIPEQIPGYACSVFDQGLGRSIWFIGGGDVNHIARTIDTFAQDRRQDLWGGVGYACAYAGGAERATIEALKNAADVYQFQLAQGTAYAAKSRQSVGNYSPYTELACQVLWGMSTDAVANTLVNHQALESQSWHHYRARVFHPVRTTLAA
ncbi:MAG: DUF1702 family protein [Nostoc sp. ChiSLP02]|nr:DUF1702 family protein [Nostoc sp. DedSLP05]MDZ8103951.1 DUF1702 family protein [Nostoc sp. DedSLP01]MDZ8187171.1 DUF1702 family protein [Nostoc sp. ChiSLP02]